MCGFVLPDWLPTYCFWLGLTPGKSLEKRQADLINRLFSEGEQRGINVTRLVVRAIELRIIDPERLVADE